MILSATMAQWVEWGVPVHEVTGSIPTLNSLENMLDINIQVHTLFGNHMSEQKSQTVPQYILGLIQKQQHRPEYIAGKKPKQFRSMSLCRIYTLQYIAGKLEEFRTVYDDIP